VPAPCAQTVAETLTTQTTAAASTNTTRVIINHLRNTINLSPEPWSYAPQARQLVSISDGLSYVKPLSPFLVTWRECLVSQFGSLEK
jgi:hypothetical protein